MTRCTMPILIFRHLIQFSIIQVQTMITGVHIIPLPHRSIQRIFTHKAQCEITLASKVFTIVEVRWHITVKMLMNSLREKDEAVLMERYCKRFVRIVVRIPSTISVRAHVIRPSPFEDT